MFPLLLLLQVGEIEAAEKNKMREKCQKIIDHGINCFINRQLIYNFPEEIFADAGERQHARLLQRQAVHNSALLLSQELSVTAKKRLLQIFGLP